MIDVLLVYLGGVYSGVAEVSAYHDYNRIHVLFVECCVTFWVLDDCVEFIVHGHCHSMFYFNSPSFLSDICDYIDSIRPSSSYMKCDGVS